MLSFVCQMLPSRVVFGAGSLEKLPEEIARLGASKALVLSTPEQRQSGRELAEHAVLRDRVVVVA
jgi:alcohol dehydrogenase class IV